MNFDFTVVRYAELLDALQKENFQFSRMDSFFGKISFEKEKTIILRHDVDKKPLNSLAFAKIQAERNIYGTYYFRILPESFNEAFIRKIAGMGHEIGYHYETMDTSKGNIEKAWDEFRYNLDIFRKIVQVNSICMHGSPLSPYDNKAIWQKYDYRSLGIMGEPYLDIDFTKVGYLTDTGRRWNGSSVSIRDKVLSPYYFNFRSTREIIENLDQLPAQMMFTFHPQRWNDNLFDWSQELVFQNLKNIIKSIKQN